MTKPFALLTRSVLSVGIAGLALSCVARADSKICGVVINQTESQPAVGDEVILLRLEDGMQQEARTVTDAQGRFSLSARFDADFYLVRVMHQGVNYDRRAAAGETLAVDVFDAAARVQGVEGSIEILRAGATGNQLHISDMYEVRNDSQPPITQAGARTFEVYLPAKAHIDSVLAAGPGKMAVIITAKAVPGDTGHFTVEFPLRPGATKFAFNYNVAYDGHLAFQTKRRYGFQQVAVMTPPTMRFSSSASFTALPVNNKPYEVHAAVGVSAGEGPSFEITGDGPLPPVAEPGGGQASVASSRQSPAAAASAPSPRESSVASPRTQSAAIAPSLLSKPAAPTALLLGIIGALAAVCTVLVWRGRRRPVPNRSD